MQAHIIENNVVINTIEVESLDFMAGLVEAPDGTGIGWSYVDGQFVDNRPKPNVIEPSLPTKEQLMAQIAALSSKISALE